MDGRLYKGEIMNFYKKKTFKDIAYYSFATYLYTAFNSVSNLFISKILGPTSLGVINYFNAIDSNVNNVLYGTVRSAVEREVPQIKDPEEKAVYIEKSLTLNFILLLLVSFVYLTIAIFSEDNLIRYSASTVAVLNLIKGGTDFYKSWHKSLDHIRSVSLVMIFSALLIPVFVILFSHVWGLEGFWYGRIVVQGLTFIVYFYLLHFVFTLKKISLEFIVYVLKSGGIPVLFSLIVSLFQTMDKFVIKEVLGLEVLGFYSLGAMVFSMLMLIPTSVTGAIFPKFMGMAGMSLKENIVKYSLVVEYLCFICCIIAIGLIPVLIEQFLNQYLPSIPIIKVLLIAFLTYSSVQLKYIDIIRNKKMRILIISSAICLFVTLSCFAYLFFNGTDNIISIAWISVLGFTLLSFTLNLSWGMVYNFPKLKMLWLLFSTFIPLLVISPFYISSEKFMFPAITSLVMGSGIYYLRYRLREFEWL